MKEVTTIGLDLAKNVFQIHGVDAAGKTVVQQAPFEMQFPASINPPSTALLRVLSPAMTAAAMKANSKAYSTDEIAFSSFQNDDKKFFKSTYLVIAAPANSRDREHHCSC